MTFLIVRDRATGRPISIFTGSIPKAIRPDNWFENPYWRHRPDADVYEPLIYKYLNKRNLKPHEVRFIAQYLVDYACHIAVMGYIFAPDKQGYEFNVECIRRLRALRGKAKTRADLREMLRVGRDYALDPL